MENLLKRQFLDVINTHRNGNSPEWTTEPNVQFEDISDSQFDIVDPKDAGGTSIKRGIGQGTASYYNGQKGNTYKLRFISYEEYLDQFVFNDGQGNTNRSMLPGIKRADLIVYNVGDDRVYFIIHELCVGNVANKIAKAKIQVNTTLNLLYQSNDIKSFIDSFEKKICFVSAKDGRVATPNDIANGFMQVYNIIPSPISFSFGRIKTLGFEAFETSIVVLDK